MIATYPARDALACKVSVFAGSTTVIPVETSPLHMILARIQNGTYQKPIEHLRALYAAGDHTAYRTAKEQAIAFTPCCAMRTRAQGTPWADKLLQVTGLVHFDLDHVDHPAAVKAQLTDNPHILFAFISPSGAGLKIGVAATNITGPDDYKHAWHTLFTYFVTTYPALQVSQDVHIKYLNALCFVSYDPMIYINSEASPFVVPPPLPSRPRPIPAVSHELTSPHVASALYAIPNYDTDYDTWLALGMALHSTGESWGRQLWDDWSRQSQKFDEGKQDKTWRSFSSDGSIHIGTLFQKAKDAGWRAPIKRDAVGRRQDAVRAVPDMSLSTNGPYPPMEEKAPSAHVVSSTPYGDLFYAEWLQALYGDSLRYCPPWKTWLVWNGTHWEQDSGAVIMEKARSTLRHLGHQAVEDDNAPLLKHYAKTLNHQPLTRLIAQASTLPGMTLLPTQLDQHSWLLNCPNGTLDLRTGLLHAHCKEEYLTRCLAVPYLPEAQAPTWHAFLWRIMGGTVLSDTPEDAVAVLEARQQADQRATRLTTFLQRMLGYGCAGDTSEEALFLLYGSGRNGKSLLLRLVRTVLGPYAKAADMQSFLHRDRETVRNDLADLAGARLVCASEANERARFAEGLVKQLTGTDPIKARFLFKEYFEFLPEFKIILAFNHKPRIAGTDEAIWARIKLIPFEVFIPPEERDKHLGDKLCTELPGILAWLVQGCLAWQRDGLGEPEDITRATQEYRTESNAIEQFVGECCLKEPFLKTASAVLFHAYTRWCDDNKEVPKSQTAFGVELGRMGFDTTEGHGHKKFRQGLGLYSAE